MSAPLPRSKSLKDFCSTFEAQVEKSQKRFYRRSRIDPIEYTQPQVSYNVEEIEAVAIHIPIYKLDDFLGVVDEQRCRELEIRAAVPAVKKAYEHYKLLLKMCGGDFDARY